MGLVITNLNYNKGRTAAPIFISKLLTYTVDPRYNSNLPYTSKIIEDLSSPILKYTDMSKPRDEGGGVFLDQTNNAPEMFKLTDNSSRSYGCANSY